MKDRETRCSRRTFLQAAVVSGVATSAAGRESTTPADRAPDPERQRLEAIARRYGAELGPLEPEGR